MNSQAHAFPKVCERMINEKPPTQNGMEGLGCEDGAQE